MLTITVPVSENGVRLDRILRKQLSLLNLAAIYRLIRTGGVKVGGKRVAQNYRCCEGDRIDIAVDGAEAQPKKTADSDTPHASLVNTAFFKRNFLPLYEDEHLLVCNKPTGLVVHAGTGHTGHDTLIDLAMSHCRRSGGRQGGTIEPILVHRLDRDTSGVILLAKDKALLRSLHEDLRSREMHKEYVALCHGVPKKLKDTIDLAIQRAFEREDGTKMVVSPGGQRAITDYRVSRTRHGISQLEVRLHTGRTHQIRVHLAHIDSPVIGDVRYGDTERDREFFKARAVKRRLFLHAARITFFHPLLAREVSFEAPLPPEFTELIAG